MISVLFGGRGQGMSRDLCEMANERFQNAKGSIVFIDKDEKHIYDLDRGIRLVNAFEYHIEGPQMFAGFVAGIAAQDFDLEAVYVSSFAKIVKQDPSSLEWLFGFLKTFSDTKNIDFIIELNTGGECPDFIKQYIA